MLQSENLVLYDNTLTLLLLHPSASTALVEWSGVDRLQADSHCLQVLLAGTDTIVPCWQTLLDSKHRGSTVYIVCVLPRHCHCLTAVHGCQPSVTELFSSPALISGTVFLSTSHQHRHWPCRPSYLERSSSARHISTVTGHAGLISGTVFLSTSHQHDVAILHSCLKTYHFRHCFPQLYHSLVMPDKWHVITDTLSFMFLLTYLLTGFRANFYAH